MIRTVCIIIASVLICASGTTALAGETIASAADDRSVLQADRALVQAFVSGDKQAVDRLLDADFSWIDSNGKILTRTQVLEHFPAPANADVEVQERTYGDSVVVRANRGKYK